jgi:hypothetical protein
MSLRGIKRSLATREDNLAWLFVSERRARLTRQAVNYIVPVAGETQSSGASGRTCSVTPAATISRIRAPICGPCRTTSATAPKHTAHYTGLPGTGSRACGGSAAREGTPRPCTTSWAVPPGTNTTSRRNRHACAGHVRPPGGALPRSGRSVGLGHHDLVRLVLMGNGACAPRMHSMMHLSVVRYSPILNV